MSQDLKKILENSRKALEEMKRCSQEDVDLMCRVINKAVHENAEELAKLAVEETGMGNVESKIVKNTTMGSGVWLTMKNKKSVGIIGEDREKGLVYVAHPKGVIGSVSPITNPTITPLGNAMLAIKGRNTIIVSPHPRAQETTGKTIEYMNQALAEIDAPENVIQMVKDPSIEATQELMASSDVIVATGGMGMVKAAYSSGRPAFGVGQGNVQAVIGQDYDDLELAAEFIIMGRTFDNGLICACNQSVIVHEDRKADMVKALEDKGAYFIEDKEDVDKIRKILFEDGVLKIDIVGKTAFEIASKAGLDIPEDTSALVVATQSRGSEDPLCGEKLCPVLILTTYSDFEDGVEIAKANLLYQGAGHTAVVHSNDREKIEYAAVELPVGRLLVNVPGIAAGGGGLFTHLNPTPSLGCGSWGGNSISENLIYEHLLNISTIAYPRKGEPPTDEEIWAE
ncbi:MAG TPA: aldehyde dehydrogenase family protein [Tepidimicrobium sp.]|nr:aldehyde dehydrogenase family protein [Tepidimicrobium sp.]